MSERWLLITVSTAGASSTLRVHAWRSLRGLGAHYLQQSVCLLPERPATTRAVGRLAAKVSREGGEARVLHVGLADEGEERELVAAFSRERDDEYGEVFSRTGEFLAEIEMERARGRATYTEVEESDADLQRFQRWLAAIRARDYFDSPGYEEARAAVERCEQELAAFEAEALANELPPSEDELEARAPRRFRAVDGEEGS